MIYKLSPILGGRSEVAKLSLMEALGHMCLLKDEEENKKNVAEMNRYLEFLAMVHANPPQDNKQAKAREAFERNIKPKAIQKMQEPKKETDIELLRKLKEGG